MRSLFILGSVGEELKDLDRRFLECADPDTGEISDEQDKSFEDELEQLLTVERGLIEEVLTSIKEERVLAEGYASIAKEYSDKAKVHNNRCDKHEALILRVVDDEPFKGKFITATKKSTKRCNVKTLEDAVKEFTFKDFESMAKFLGFKGIGEDELEKYVKVAFSIKKSVVKGDISKGDVVEGCSIDPHYILKIGLR